jgi:hypothetical protein
MAIYQKRPDTIDAVLISNPPQSGAPPFQPPIPDWLNDAVTQGVLTWVYEDPTTTVTLHFQPSGTARSTAYTGEYVIQDVTTKAIGTITAELLDQYYTRGPAEPTVVSAT